MRTFTRGLASVATAAAVTLAPMSVANAQSSLLSSSSETAPPSNWSPTPSPSPAPNVPSDAEGKTRLKTVLEEDLRGLGNSITPAGNSKAEQWAQRAVNGEVYFTGSEWVKSIPEPEGGVLVVRIPKSELNYYLSILQGNFSGIRNGEAGAAVASDQENFYGTQFYIF